MRDVLRIMVCACEDVEMGHYTTASEKKKKDSWCAQSQIAHNFPIIRVENLLMTKALTYSI